MLVCVLVLSQHVHDTALGTRPRLFRHAVGALAAGVVSSAAVVSFSAAVPFPAVVPSSAVGWEHTATVWLLSAKQTNPLFVSHTVLVCPAVLSQHLHDTSLAWVPLRNLHGGVIATMVGVQNSNNFRHSKNIFWSNSVFWLVFWLVAASQ